MSEAFSISGTLREAHRTPGKLAQPPGYHCDRLFLPEGVYCNPKGGGGLVVYLDLVMGLNFLVDFLLLLGANRLSGFPAGTARCALGAGIGAIYSGACFLPGFRFLGNLLWRGVSFCLMSAAAFGMDGASVKRGSIFFLLNMTMGGIALGLGKNDYLSVVLCAVLCLVLCRLCFGTRAGSREYLPLEITWQDRSVSLIALRDTGNTLRDPLTGEPVLVISPEAACRLTGLTPAQLRQPLETLADRPTPGLRLIPYQAVGKTGDFLLAKRFEQVTIGNTRRSALVAFAPEGLGRGEIHQALTGG